MKTFLYLLLASCFYTNAYTQEKEVVLVNGNPPLTQLMAGKAIVILEWALDIPFTSSINKYASDT